MERPPEPLALGTILDGRYRLDELVGEGAHGRVYRAVHVLAQLPCAVKVLRADASGGSRERFFREATVANRLRKGAHLHPHVVLIFDVGRDAEQRADYLAMEWLHGESLDRHLRAHGRLEAREAWAILRPVADALALAHAQGIVHRDLKPANVFLASEPDGRRTPKLLDFGVAQLSDVRTTLAKTLLGSPPYMAPETFYGGAASASPASDVWSLGVVLFELLTGRVPFLGEGVMGTLGRAAADPLPESEHLRPPLRAVLERALAKDVADRYPHAGALATAMDTLV